MTPKDKTKATLLTAGLMPDEAVAIVEATDLEPLREPAPVVVLDTATAAEALAELRRLRDEHAHVVVRAQVTDRPNDQDVAEGHAFDGTREGGRWHFTAASFDMARRVAGWRKVEHVEPGKLRLS